MTHIFLSYSREDEERIQPLVRVLNENGLSVFWDRHIPAGQTWRSYIGKALTDASCILVAWSNHSIESDWVSEEADEGKRRRILVPFLLDSVEPPLGFRSIQSADLSDWQPDHPSPRFEKLLQDVRSVLNSAPTPPLPNRLADQENHMSVRHQEPGNMKPKPISPYLKYGLWTTLLILMTATGGYWIYHQWQWQIQSAVSSFDTTFEMRATAEVTGNEIENRPEYKFTIFVNSTPAVLDSIKEVEYKFNHPTFNKQTEIARSAEDKFSTQYIGWGCLRSLSVSVLMKDGTSRSFEFNMCKSLGSKWDK